ncbi:MAG: hypothetical protein WCP21_16775, partial [Armatimonadota bacterium]
MRPLTLCLVLVVICSALLLAGCGGSNSGASMLSGRVYDDGTRLPLSGIKVLIPSVQQVVTAADGLFVFNRGASSLVVAGAGYLTQTVTVPTGGSQIDLGIIYLVPSPVAGYGNVSGNIVEAG